MTLTKAGRMAKMLYEKSLPSKPIKLNDAQRVERAIRSNPKLYKGLSPSQVLDMLNSSKVIGKPIKGRKKKPMNTLPKPGVAPKKITKKKFGGIMKGIKAIKDKFNKKDSKGNTTSILGKPSANQQKTKKAIKQTRTTKREKAKSLAKGIIGTTVAYEGMKALKGDKSKAPATPTDKKPKAKKAMPTKTPTPRPKKKSSGVTFGFEVIPKGGKTKKFSGGGKVGGMKSGSATPNRLY
jgi:hypothetical protein|tara:strand:+ start:1702 stop:2412 length:711 start_codon:yes stop_codon:yes gene_type:complete